VLLRDFVRLAGREFNEHVDFFFAFVRRVFATLSRARRSLSVLRCFELSRAISPAAGFVALGRSAVSPACGSRAHRE
jgi:hypothetical protein